MRSFDDLFGPSGFSDLYNKLGASRVAGKESKTSTSAGDTLDAGRRGPRKGLDDWSSIQGFALIGKLRSIKRPKSDSYIYICIYVYFWSSNKPNKMVVFAYHW